MKQPPNVVGILSFPHYGTTDPLCRLKGPVQCNVFTEAMKSTPSPARVTSPLRPLLSSRLDSRNPYGEVRSYPR